MVLCLNSFLANGNFCHLLITFANSLDPDQDRQDVGPDLDSSCFTLIMFLKEFFGEKLFYKKCVDDSKFMNNYAACKELTIIKKKNRTNRLAESIVALWLSLLKNASFV